MQSYDTYESLEVRLDGPVAWITMARPQAANALNTSMRTELVDAVESLHADPAVKVLVLTGRGPAFCAGSDIGEVIPSSAHIARVRDLNIRLLTLLRCGDKPTLALMRGAAAGIGLSMALCCDLRYATATVRLHTSFGRLGLSADGGLTWLLTRTIGLARGMEMLYTEEPVSAEKAERWGLVNAIVDEEAIEAHVARLAEQLSQRSGAALAAMKASMNEAGELSFQQVLSREFDRQATLMDGAEFQQRFARFRAPR